MSKYKTYPNQKIPTPNNAAKKLLPSLLDKIKPVKKQMINGVYHGRKNVSKKLRMDMMNIFMMNITFIYFVL